MIVTAPFTSRVCVGFLVLMLALTCWLTPARAQINLSDIVAGGNGDGLGWTPDDDIDFGGDRYAAVNLDNGTFMTRLETDQFHNGTTDGDGINPSPCEGAPFSSPDDAEEIEGGRFIDSVFFLPTVDVPLNQENVQFPYLQADVWGNSWNHVLSNRTHDIDKNPPREDIFAGGSADWETGIGIHAAAGITFDLDAIREEHGAENVVSFSTFIGADRCGAQINFYVIFSDEDGIIDDPNGNQSFTDGGNEIRYWVEASNPTSAAQYIGEIPEGAMYLTLTVGARNNSISCDHGVLANPQILDFVPPTPVEDLACVPNAAGDWDVSWTPQENPPPDPIRILVDGDEVAQVPADASSYTLSLDEAPGESRVCIENGAPFQSCCTVRVPEVLDGGWSTADIADSGLAGDASVEQVGDDPPTFDMEITGSGHDIWDAADDFRYVWKVVEATDEVTIQARLDSFDRATNDWGKAGLMMRKDDTQGSPYVFNMFRPGPGGSITHGSTLQWRDTPDGGAAWDGSFLTEYELPMWIRATYEDGLVSGFVAPDTGDVPEEADWIPTTAPDHLLNLDGSETFLVGVAVTSHDDNALETALFSEVSLSCLDSEACFGEPSAGASLKPGDANGDGNLNITDAVALLGALFSDGELPGCFTVPGSQPTEYTEAGKAMLDFNGDGGVNITDAVAALGFLFAGADNSPHALGVDCVTIAGTCTDSCR